MIILGFSGLLIVILGLCFVFYGLARFPVGGKSAITGLIIMLIGAGLFISTLIVMTIEYLS